MAGDCEDFSLAKYFTLKLLGIPEEKLKLTYVKAWKINQAHMVVTYYPTPDAEPLVLDNLIDTIEFASETEMTSCLSTALTGSGLWLSKERGRGKHIGGSNRLSLWNDLLTRMPEES
jgi:predicted transglutaminase-like cysteine proteinase